MAVGTSQQVAAIGTFSDGSTKEMAAVSWTSNNPSVAVASASGLVTATAAGTTMIIASVGSITGSISLTASAATLTSIVVTPAVPQLALDTSKQLTATGVFSDGSIQDLTSAVVWSSSDASVATVSNIGLANAAAIGTSTITATTGAVSGSTSLSVISVSLVSIAVMPSSVTMAKGTSFQYTLIGTFSDGSTQALIARNWKSSKPNLAPIRKNGLVRGKHPGSATITATYGSLSASATVTVSSARMLSMVLSPVNPSIAANTKQQFQALGLFEDGLTQDVTGMVSVGSVGGSTVLTVTGASLV